MDALQSLEIKYAVEALIRVHTVFIKMRKFSYKPIQS